MSHSDASDAVPAPTRPAGARPVAARRASSASSATAVIERLDDGRELARDRGRSWLLTVVVCLAAFGLRIWHMDFPKYLVFDETYYPKDAWTMLHLGYEANWPTNANTDIAAGHVMGFASKSPGFTPNSAEFVVHPPLGKWIIALGEKAFGMNSFGWRFMSVVFGTLLVGATIRLARRLSRSTLVGVIAGLLLTFDGLAFTMSRIGLLDIFQATFITAAVALVVRDRDWFRHRLADHLVRTGRRDLAGSFGPALWWRPWRVAAGITFGLACGVKWNSMFVLATISLLSLAWDCSARRLAGASSASLWSLLRDGVPAFVSLVVVAFPVYLASWTGWLMSKGGWDRQWGANPTSDHSLLGRHHDWLVHHLGAPLASLLFYHHEIYDFHTGSYMAHQTHTYNANPAGWLLMVRPIGIDAVNDIKPGTLGCHAVNDTCLRVISGAGTPVLWWMAAIAAVAGLVLWVAARDWRFAAPIVAFCSTWLPWFKYDDRPVFFFYAICIVPFTVTMLAILFGRILGPADGAHRRRRAWIVGGLVALVVLNFAFQFPVLTDGLLTRHAWLMRMWFPSWI